jgi:ABC-type antimicrobial peptide transport system permease subunit
MTPTDTFNGEAPYVFHASRPAALSSTVMAVKVNGDPAAFASRVRELAWDVDARLRIEELRRLDDWIGRIDLPALIAVGAIITIVAIGLCLSAAAIFSLMSVTVARRTREIGLRAALGASNSRLLAGVFARAALLVGSGIAAGNLFIALVVLMDGDVTLSFVAGHLFRTSAVMLTVGLLACVQPARRALRIDPATALRDI